MNEKIKKIISVFLNCNVDKYVRIRIIDKNILIEEKKHLSPKALDFFHEAIDKGKIEVSSVFDLISLDEKDRDKSLFYSADGEIDDIVIGNVNDVNGKVLLMFV